MCIRDRFIDPEIRSLLLKKIADGLMPGGLLLLSEKISADDDVCNNLLVDLHLDFKRANGYSELEIAQKRTAIEKVMRIDSLPEHIERLKNAGFNHQTPWFQCFNFFSLIAIK